MKSYGGDVEKSSEESNEFSNSRSGSQRSVRSSKKEETNDDSDSSSKNTNQIHYSDQQQAELLRKLDSIKNHLIRPKESDQSQMNFPGHGPSYYHPYPLEPFPYQIPLHGMYNPPQVAAFRDSYGVPIHQRPQNWFPSQYQNQIPRPYPPGQYVDIGPDILEPQLQDPRLLTPNRYAEKTGPFVSHKYNDSVSSSAVYGHTRLRSEIASESDGVFGDGFAQKADLDIDVRRCHPLAGGAPFIACDNCFELLYLPKKKLLGYQQKQQKLECGGCSEAISFTILDKKLVFSSLNVETNRVSEIEDQSSKPVEESRKEEVILKNIKEPVLSSEHSDEEERSKEVIVKSVRRRVVKVEKTPEPAPGENSNLLELFEYSNVNRAALAYGMQQLGYNKQESYMKQDSIATETEVSYNGYSNTEVSEDSRKEEMVRSRNEKEESEYSFSEITKRNSYEESEEEIQTQCLDVWVNGYLIPEELVIRAEKQAGPVQAGNYWYDYRAGFWGVMGNPCLGIIPPFIEEFSRPMPDKCGAGNTGVTVNGRELHERDLELLAKRGLPREKNRSYIIDISGRVLDGDSGQELDSLGKLAPTIEKVKHGFGMRVPRSLVS